MLGTEKKQYRLVVEKKGALQTFALASNSFAEAYGAAVEAFDGHSEIKQLVELDATVYVVG
jgi:hypothetical protein